MLGTACALLLNVHAYAPFLSAIGAIFLPAFTVVLVDHYLLSDRSVDTSELARRKGRYWYSGGYNCRALLAWLVASPYTTGPGSLACSRSNKVIASLAACSVIQCRSEPSNQNVRLWGEIPCIVATSVAYLLLVDCSGVAGRICRAKPARPTPQILDHGRSRLAPTAHHTYCSAGTRTPAQALLLMAALVLLLSAQLGKRAPQLRSSNTGS